MNFIKCRCCCCITLMTDTNSSGLDDFLEGKIPMAASAQVIDTFTVKFLTWSIWKCVISSTFRCGYALTLFVLSVRFPTMRLQVRSGVGDVSYQPFFRRWFHDVVELHPRVAVLLRAGRVRTSRSPFLPGHHQEHEEGYDPSEEDDGQDGDYDQSYVRQTTAREADGL